MGRGKHTEEAHRVEGVGMDTVVRCDDTDNAYGPGTTDPTAPDYCPYCGESVDRDEHRVDMSFDVVFCENTIMSRWRYCPGCGESGLEINAE
jgi:hypothetical protein